MNGMTTGPLAEGTCTLSVVVPVYNEAKLASYVGMLSALLAFAYGTFSLVKALFLGDPVQGFPTLIATVLFIDEHVPATQSAARLANELFRAGGR